MACGDDVEMAFVRTSSIDHEAGCRRAACNRKIGRDVD